MTFNIDILMLKNAGCTLAEIIEIIPYDCKVITFIYNNDTLVITDNWLLHYILLTSYNNILL